MKFGIKEIKNPTPKKMKRIGASLRSWRYSRLLQLAHD